MAVTHDDLSLRKNRARRRVDIGGQLGVVLVALSVLCGIVAFILCLAAEGSRSEVSWYVLTVRGDGTPVSECYYNTSGRTPLACAVCAFLLFAVAMISEHAYMLLAVAIPESSSLGLTVANGRRAGVPPSSSDESALTWQACCLFLVTWICFGLAEVMLMIGIGVESGHVTDWNQPKSSCHVVRTGMFVAAGILGLVSVFLGFVVYLMALRAQRLREGEHVAGPADAGANRSLDSPAAAACQAQPPQQGASYVKGSCSV